MEVDLSRLPAGVRQRMDDIFRGDHDLKVLKAVQRQTQTAAKRRDAVRWHDAMAPQYEIDPYVDSLWRQFYGYNYTENKDLMRFLAARNPEIVVRARSNKIQVGYAASEKQKAESRKQKSRSGVRFMPGTIQLAS